MNGEGASARLTFQATYRVFLNGWLNVLPHVTRLVGHPVYVFHAANIICDLNILVLSGYGKIPNLSYFIKLII